MKKSMAGVYLIKSEKLYDEFIECLNKAYKELGKELNISKFINNLWEYVQSEYGDFYFCIRIEQYNKDDISMGWDFIDSFRDAELNIGDGLKGRYCIHEYKGGYITTEKGFAIGDCPIALSQKEVSELKGVWI